MLEARLYVTSDQVQRAVLNTMIIESLSEEINQLKAELEETPLEAAEQHVSQAINGSRVDDYQDDLERMHIA